MDRCVVQLPASPAQRQIGVRNGGGYGPVGEHQALPLAVGGLAVGSMQARVGHLPGSKEACHAGLTIQTGLPRTLGP